MLDESEAPFYKWFVGGKLNASHHALDRHVDAGRGDRVAFHWRGEEGEERDVTYAELLRDTKRLANVLKDRGIEPGDVVGIYLPMIPEVAVAMLACARIGAPHNVVFGGFSPDSVKERMEFSEAKALITVDQARRKGKAADIKPAVDEFLGDVPSIETVVVVREHRRPTWTWRRGATSSTTRRSRPRPRTARPSRSTRSTRCTCSTRAARPRSRRASCTRPAATSPAWRWTHKYVFDLKPDEDVYWCSADVGWVTGHSYIVYGPLMNGATSVMFEGAPDYPDKDIWWELCERYGVTIFYTAPTAIRACMKWGIEYPQKHDLSKLRLLGTVGEPINPKAWLWYWKVIGGERCPIVDTWWQTETGHIMISPLPGRGAGEAGLGHAAAARASTRPCSTRTATRSRAASRACSRCAGPWPGMLRTLYRDPDRFKETYFSKWDEKTYFVGDAARRDEDGYFWVIGRVDDTVNVSGHLLSTATVESAIVSHPKVAEAAVIGIEDEDTGQAIVRVRDPRGRPRGRASELEGEVRERVADRIGKFSRPEADHLDRRRAEDALRQDHAPPAARHRRGPRGSAT